MSSRSLKSLTKTIGFRLTVWYASLFILSGLVLFGVTYALLASSLQQRDRDGIRLKLRDLAAQYQLAGLERMQQELAAQATLQQTRPFFIRVATPSNATLFLKLPDRGPAFDVRRLERRAVTGTDAWLKVRAKGKDEVLEVASTRLPDGSLLQVGRSTEERDELLEAFGGIVLGILIPVVGGGVIGGTFLALRALRPIRHLIETVRAIESGTLGARVPTRQSGVAGLMLEDQTWPKRCGHLQGKEVIPAEEMVAKLHAACDARRNPAFVVMARTDAFATHGLPEVLCRLTRYAEAGADLLFADALVSEADIASVARHVPKPLCVNMGFSIRTRATTPLIAPARLQELGVAVVIYPRLLTACAVRGMQHAIAALRDAMASPTVVERPELAVSFEELNALVGFAELQAQERRYAATLAPEPRAPVG